jgi:hypothetical protein
MFVRFRSTKTRLQLSLIQTMRVDGRVRHEHVGSLGSIRVPATAYDRLEFWQKLHQRLQRLDNRVDDIGRIMTAVHERVPMVTLDEQRELKISTAEEEARRTQSLHDMHEETVSGQKQLVQKAQSAIADGEAQMAVLAAEAAAAKQRAERLRQGEDVMAAIRRAMTQKELMAAIGWTKADLRAARVGIELERLGILREAIDHAVAAGRKP